MECTTDDRLVQVINCSTFKSTRERGILQKRWTNAVSEFIRAKNISYKDTRGMVFDYLLFFSPCVGGGFSA